MILLTSTELNKGLSFAILVTTSPDVWLGKFLDFISSLLICLTVIFKSFISVSFGLSDFS